MADRLFAGDSPSMRQWQQHGEPAVAKFEAAWRIGTRPNLADYLNAPTALRPILLAELIHSDLKHRIAAGEKARVEDYMTISDLDPQRLEALIRAEFELRRQKEPNLDPAEFMRRFPGRITRLGSASHKPAELEFSATVAGVAPQTPVPASLPADPLGMSGSVLANKYKLIQLLGEGGMGAVWMAEQSEPIRRMVAVKLIKPGMDSSQVLARFEAERQALALMDHPNIARVYDAGSSADGRPFFVMELVQGIPLTRYCDEQKLTPRERIELFTGICRGVQHAHQKGIIHRDLKPDNVIVGKSDGRPIPKIIDFGVAKAAGLKLTDRTMHTALGAIIGTLEYMAPEQVTGDNIDVDTRADIYALGVMLYETLTGRLPFSRKELAGKALLDLLKHIREVEPPKPSTKLSSSENLATIAANRKSDPGRLPKQVSGDLDWIVMKCLEKDRTRRYETANGLALELHRYLADEPVLAGPPSTAYRLQKFIRRNRQAVIAASLLVIALMGGITGTTWGLLQARTALQESRRQTDIASEVNDFLQKDILLQADSQEQADRGFEQDPNLTIKKALARAAERIGNRFNDKPLVEAAIRMAIGNAYRGIGEPRLAIPQLEKALELREQYLEADSPIILGTRNDLAIALRAVGRTDEAIRLFEAVAERLTATVGPNHLETLTTQNNLASAYRDAHRTADAIRLFEQVRDRRQIVHGVKDPLTLSTVNNLALVYLDAGRTTDAIPLLEQVRVGFGDNLGPSHPETLSAENNLANAYRAAQRTDDAIRLLEKVRDRRVAQLGADHPSTLLTLNNLANCYVDVGRTADAIVMYKQTYEQQVKKLVPDHSDARLSLDNWARTLFNDGQYEAALPVFRDLLASQTRVLPPDDLARLRTLAYTGTCLLKLNKPADAEPLLRECLSARQRLQPDAWTTMNTMSLMGASLLDQKKFAVAEPLLIDGFEGMKKSQDKIPPLYRSLLVEAGERVVKLYESTGKNDEAAKAKQELASVKAKGGH